jgi:hypothetical protein
MADYNGWTNKETWLVNLWLREHFQQELKDGYEITSAHIKDTINNMLSDSPELWGLFSDLLDCALGEINCYEIAAHYAREEEKEDA